MSRRNALPIFGAGLVVAAALPSIARADDDTIAAIAARANAKAAAEREEKKPKPVREEGEGTNLVSAQSPGHFCWWEEARRVPSALLGRTLTAFRVPRTLAGRRRSLRRRRAIGPLLLQEPPAPRHQDRFGRQRRRPQLHPIDVPSSTVSAVRSQRHSNRRLSGRGTQPSLPAKLSEHGGDNRRRRMCCVRACCSVCACVRVCAFTHHTWRRASVARKRGPSGRPETEDVLPSCNEY